MTRLGNTLDRQEVEVLAIGAGPANLSLAVALEELAPEMARETVIVEQHDTVVWQRGLLLPWSQSQVSFLKDLVTRRNPRSKYSFVNFLHETDRLDDFINLGSFTPYRMEISDYLSWVARNLSEVRIQSGRRCVSVEPCYDTDGDVSEWLVRTGRRRRDRLPEPDHRRRPRPAHPGGVRAAAARAADPQHRVLHPDHRATTGPPSTGSWCSAAPRARPRCCGPATRSSRTPSAPW